MAHRQLVATWAPFSPLCHPTPPYPPHPAPPPPTRLLHHVLCILKRAVVVVAGGGGTRALLLGLGRRRPPPGRPPRLALDARARQGGPQLLLPRLMGRRARAWQRVRGGQAGGPGSSRARRAHRTAPALAPTIHPTSMRSMSANVMRSALNRLRHLSLRSCCSVGGSLQGGQAGAARTSAELQNNMRQRCGKRGAGTASATPHTPGAHTRPRRTARRDASSWPVALLASTMTDQLPRPCCMTRSTSAASSSLLHLTGWRSGAGGSGVGGGANGASGREAAPASAPSGVAAAATPPTTPSQALHSHGAPCGAS